MTATESSWDPEMCTLHLIRHWSWPPAQGPLGSRYRCCSPVLPFLTDEFQRNHLQFLCLILPDRSLWKGKQLRISRYDNLF
ncbi:hypothetical protein N7468_005218 [Penicillium chermesinum]|uniref:Uncharacterized protein n=1 Tax=Penicillium chermesinum TaxID=63820 RepID=A0A9W9NYW5_9EURO|nr:uncharacterized protein N7468_005218 [Penicillium chermesinum]KAJ5232262.1 hypothetical protein N7468_005218 [Penicillium chermesinum]